MQRGGGQHLHALRHVPEKLEHVGPLAQGSPRANQKGLVPAIEKLANNPGKAIEPVWNFQYTMSARHSSSDDILRDYVLLVRSEDRIGGTHACTSGTLPVRHHGPHQYLEYALGDTDDTTTIGPGPQERWDSDILD